jgi:hypothetical protein
MPIKEACHVAVQRNHASKHRLWKHAQARQNAKGQGPTPVLQIVSMTLNIEPLFPHTLIHPSSPPVTLHIRCRLLVYAVNSAVITMI